MGQVSEQQIQAVRDDGTESGVVRVETVTGDLVMQHFRNGHFFAQGSGIAFSTQGFPGNSDGSNTRLTITLAHGAGGLGSRIWVPFHGNVFGVRWLRDSSAPAFTLMIDGQAKAIAHPQDERLVGNGITVSDQWCLSELATDLGPGPHVAEICMVQDATVDRTLVLYGYVVERRAGYPQPEVKCQNTTSPTAFASNAAVSFWGSVAESPVAIDAIEFVNNSAVLQVETATVIGTITGSGNASVTVTGAGITGSPVTLSVAVLNGDTATAVAAKIATAINANTAIAALYYATSSGATVILTAIVPAANDATLNVATDNGSCTGLTAAPTSANTTAGSAGQSAVVQVLRSSQTLWKKTLAPGDTVTYSHNRAMSWDSTYTVQSSLGGSKVFFAVWGVSR